MVLTVKLKTYSKSGAVLTRDDIKKRYKRQRENHILNGALTHGSKRTNYIDFVRYYFNKKGHYSRRSLVTIKESRRQLKRLTDIIKKSTFNNVRGASELSKTKYYGLSHSRVDIIIKRGHESRPTAGILSIRGYIPGTTRR